MDGLSQELDGFESGKVQVFCRVRPLSSLEKQYGEARCLKLSADGKRVAFNCDNPMTGDKRTNFKFNHVFEENCSQQDVYNLVGRPMLDAVMKGYNGTVLAYGQTSSGKTYTMQGVDPHDEAVRGEADKSNKRTKKHPASGRKINSKGTKRKKARRDVRLQEDLIIDIEK